MHWRNQHHEVVHCHFVDQHQFFQFFEHRHRLKRNQNFHLFEVTRQQKVLHLSDCSCDFLCVNTWNWLTCRNFYHDFNEVNKNSFVLNNFDFLVHNFKNHCHSTDSLTDTFVDLRDLVDFFDSDDFHQVIFSRFSPLDTKNLIILFENFSSSKLVFKINVKNSKTRKHSLDRNVKDHTYGYRTYEIHLIGRICTTRTTVPYGTF